MTTPHKAAMQQALDVLQRASDAGYSIECEAAIAALTAAIDAPEPKPTAWTLTEELTKRETTTRGHLWFSDPQNCMWTPLYTHPPAVREPLTDAEIKNCAWGYFEDSSNLPEWVENFVRAIEAAHGIKS